MSARRFPPLAERFWAKADKNGPVHPVLGTPCWLWTGAKDRAGYGRFGVNGINCMAYRVSLELVTGESLDGREVCHRCDNPPCVNPTHLVNGTRSVNMRDASAKGRIRLQKHPELVPRGTDCNFAKLDEAAVRRIRELRSGGMSLNKIAAQFGITPTNVSYIARRATWKHTSPESGGTTMRIIALQSENVKRLRAVSIKPDGSLVVIKGNNGQGKTSVLDSIAYALGGEKLMPPEVIRRGTESAEVALDLGDFIVTRRWTAGGSSLAVKSHEGARYPSPQTMLDKLIGRLSFDPVAFTRQEPKAQAETVRKLSGIDFAAIDEERRDAFDRRTIVNRDVAILKGAIARLPEVEAPDEEVKFGELLAEQDRLHAQQKQIEDARRQEQVAAGELPRAIDQRDRALEAIADLERQLSRAKEALAGCERAVAKAQEKRDAAHAHFLEIDKPVDLESVKRKLAEAEGLNAKVRAKRARAVELEKLFRKESDSKGLTDKIEALDKRRAEILAGAKFPVRGLSFNEGGVTLNGLPLEQASSAEQLRVSLAVGIALNPKLRVLLIRDGSLLDEKSLRLVAEMAETAGAQVWVELVSKGGPPGIVIEDGQVDEDSTPARFLAATDLGPGRRDEHG